MSLPPIFSASAPLFMAKNQVPKNQVKDLSIQLVIPTQSEENPNARLTPPDSFQERLHHPLESLKTLWHGFHDNQATDNRMANASDTMLRFGGLSIALLATLGSLQPIRAINEFLGLATWLGGMVLTPLILNGMIWLKTGLNLNTRYINPEAEKRPVFQDANYIPDVFSPEQKQLVANRLHLEPKTSSKGNSKADLEVFWEGVRDRMRQIGIQGHTWWMLIAGLTTPILSGMLSNRLETPVKQAINSLKVGVSWSMFRQAQFLSGRSEDVLRHWESYVGHLIGETPNSRLTHWWQRFAKGMVGNLKLQKTFGMAQSIGAPWEARLLGKPNAQLTNQQLADALAQTLHGLAKNKPEQLEKALNYLQTQANWLDQLQEVLLMRLKYLKKMPHLGLSAQKETFYKTMIETRVANARFTVGRYQKLLEGLKSGQLSLDALRQGMEASTVSHVYHLIESGRWYDALEAATAGVKTLYPSSTQELDQRLGQLFLATEQRMKDFQFKPASAFLGASPVHHLMESLREVTLTRLWKNRIVYGLGGGLLLSSLLYVGLFVGRGFKKLPSVVKNPFNPQEGGLST